MRKLLAILLLPLLLVVVGAALAPKLASQARLRAEALGMMRTATGMDAAIDGDVRFSAFPWPALEARGVRIGQEGGPSLTVPHLRIVLDLLPLVTGSARADHIALADPVLTVPDRVSNTAMLAELLRRIGGGTLSGEIRVLDGLVRLVDEDGATTTTARMNATIDWRGGSALKLDGGFIWHDQPMEIDVAFSQLGELAGGRSARLRAAASGPLGELSYEGSFGFASGLSGEGSVYAAARSVRAALDWLGLDTPTEGGFGPFALKADMLYSGKSAALSRVRLELDGNVSEGGFNLRLDEGRPQIQGTLAAGTLDLAPYGQLALAGPDGNHWNRDPLETQRLQRFDLDLRLSAGEVRAGGAKLERFAASAVVRGGKLSLAIGEAEGWQGIFRASAQVAPVAAGTEVRVELACEDVALAQALGDIFRTQRVEGTGSFRLAATGTGRDIAGIVGSLDGSFRLEGANGALVGIDATRILTRLAERPLSGIGNLRGGRTPFDSLAAEATISSGIADLTTLAVDSTRLAVRMNGTASILAQELDLAGTAMLKDASGTASPFELPFVVRGDWDDPLLLPDPQSLIRRSGAARPLFGPRMEATGILGPTP
ncbi:AsmA family protein [Ancylobacter oerskovii]|uniref:AsmA family protein n=1 Tax=Ancylobacter oerskovii TaxID=459519 RepID=A0ABW4YXK2_9HYPH|nr:AsmA family protein [Ancylobacter oerskovii]MBS7542092.1 AsmA family protein [Ancylobacter oerskovii]